MERNSCFIPSFLWQRTNPLLLSSSQSLVFRMVWRQVEYSVSWYFKKHLTSQNKVLINFQHLGKILIVEWHIAFNLTVSFYDLECLKCQLLLESAI